MTDGKETLVGKIKEVLEPFCKAENFELVNLEIQSTNKEMLLRIYLDKPGGINLDDCVYASRQLGDLIDVYVENLSRYRLEVSSPGPKRPLNNKQDFQRFKGERIKIETRQPIGDKRKFTGILEMVNNDSVVIDSDGDRIEISDHLIHKARLAGQ